MARALSGANQGSQCKFSVNSLKLELASPTLEA